MPFFSGDIYLFFGISVSLPSVFGFNFFKCNYLEDFVILSAILKPIIWSVNHTSIAGNSELNVFKKIWFFGGICNKLTNGLFGTNCI